MKKENLVTSVMVSLGLFLTLFAFAGVASADTIVKLQDVKIPSNGTAKQSLPFTVSDTGQLSVKVKLRVDAAFGYGGASVYTAVLRRVGNTSNLASSGAVTVTDSPTEVTLSYNVDTCAKTGSYFVRLTNNATENPQNGVAEFPEFVAPTTSPTTGTLSTFGVTQGNTIPIGIPNDLEPNGNSGGRIKITAIWDGNCNWDPAGCILTFYLLRNGSKFSTVPGLGYSHNALFGNANPKMTIDLPVPADKVSGNWSLEVKGDSRADVSNVKTTVKFTPRCQSN